MVEAVLMIDSSLMQIIIHVGTNRFEEKKQE